jgi:hypothetical protein
VIVTIVAPDDKRARGGGFGGNGWLGNANVEGTWIIM